MHHSGGSLASSFAVSLRIVYNVNLQQPGSFEPRQWGRSRRSLDRRAIKHRQYRELLKDVQLGRPQMREPASGRSEQAVDNLQTHGTGAEALPGPPHGHPDADGECAERRRQVRDDGLECLAVAERVFREVDMVSEPDAEALKPRAVCERGSQGRKARCSYRTRP